MHKFPRHSRRRAIICIFICTAALARSQIAVRLCAVAAYVVLSSESSARRRNATRYRQIATVSWFRDTMHAGYVYLNDWYLFWRRIQSTAPFCVNGEAYKCIQDMNMNDYTKSLIIINLVIILGTVIPKIFVSGLFNLLLPMFIAWTINLLPRFNKLFDHYFKMLNYIKLL